MIGQKKSSIVTIATTVRMFLMSKIIGIIGSRRRDQQSDFLVVHKLFMELYNDDDWVCSGGCQKGGDRFAIMLHKNYYTPYLEFPADWDKHGKRAGFIRNCDIAKYSDVLIACVAKDRLGGTEHTIKEFIKLHGEDNLYIV